MPKECVMSWEYLLNQAARAGIGALARYLRERRIRGTDQRSARIDNAQERVYQLSKDAAAACDVVDYQAIGRRLDELLRSNPEVEGSAVWDVVNRKGWALIASLADDLPTPDEFVPSEAAIRLGTVDAERRLYTDTYPWLKAQLDTAVRINETMRAGGLATYASDVQHHVVVAAFNQEGEVLAIDHGGHLQLPTISAEGASLAGSPAAVRRRVADLVKTQTGVTVDASTGRWSGHYTCGFSGTPPDIRMSRADCVYSFKNSRRRGSGRTRWLSPASWIDAFDTRTMIELLDACGTHGVPTRWLFDVDLVADRCPQDPDAGSMQRVAVVFDDAGQVLGTRRDGDGRWHLPAVTVADRAASETSAHQLTRAIQTRTGVVVAENVHIVGRYSEFRGAVPASPIE